MYLVAQVFSKASKRLKAFGKHIISAFTVRI